MAKRGLFRWVAILAAMAAGGLPGVTQADTYVPLVRITCVAPASYAAVETIGVRDLDRDARAALATQGFRELSAVAQAPVECDFPEGTLVIEVVDYRPSRSDGGCTAEDGDLRISLDGRQVIFAKSLHGGCADLRRHDIRVSDQGVRHCLASFAGLAPGGNAMAVNCSSIQPF